MSIKTTVWKGEKDFREQPGGFHLGTDEIFGHDRATVEFAGAPERAARFIAKWEVGDRIPTVGTQNRPKMFFTGRNVKTRGAYTHIVCVFEGSWNGEEREPVITRSIREDSATLATDNEEDPPVSVVYRSAIVTQRYTTFTNPVSPKGFPGGAFGVGVQATPYEWNPPKSTLKGDLQFDFSRHLTLFESIVVIPQKFWRVTEQYQIRIRDTQEPEIGS